MEKLKEISRDEKTINKIVERENKNDELKINPLKKQEKEKIDELRVVGNKLQNLIDILSEVGIERFPSLRKEIENLENKKKVLEFDLEGIKLSIQKEEKEKFETKIVLENLKDFSKKIGETAPSDRPRQKTHPPSKKEESVYLSDKISNNVSPEEINSNQNKNNSCGFSHINFKFGYLIKPMCYRLYAKSYTYSKSNNR